MEQTISVKYFLCGLEGYPALIMRLFALALGILAMITMVMVVRGYLKYGLWVPDTRERSTRQKVAAKHMS